MRNWEEVNKALWLISEMSWTTLALGVFIVLAVVVILMSIGDMLYDFVMAMERPD